MIDVAAPAGGQAAVQPGVVVNEAMEEATPMESDVEEEEDEERGKSGD